MGVIFSTSKALINEAGHKLPSTPITRIRISPHTPFKPVAQDVYLPATATASTGNLFDFIKTLPIWQLLPDHELVEDGLRVLSVNGEVEIEFCEAIDRVWMAEARSTIQVTAVSTKLESKKAAEEMGAVERAVTGTALITTEEDDELEKDGESSGEKRHGDKKDFGDQTSDPASKSSDIKLKQKVEINDGRGEQEGIEGIETTEREEQKSANQADFRRRRVLADSKEATPPTATASTTESTSKLKLIPESATLDKDAQQRKLEATRREVQARLTASLASRAKIFSKSKLTGQGVSDVSLVESSPAAATNDEQASKLSAVPDPARAGKASYSDDGSVTAPANVLIRGDPQSLDQPTESSSSRDVGTASDISASDAYERRA